MMESNDQTAEEIELWVGMAQVDGVIYMNFETSVSSLGMRPEYARTIGRKLLELADEAERLLGQSH